MITNSTNSHTINFLILLDLDFSAVVDKIAKSVTTPVNIWHLGDTTFDGSPNDDMKDLILNVSVLAKIGLEMDLMKLWLINIAYDHK